MICRVSTAAEFDFECVVTDTLALVPDSDLSAPTGLSRRSMMVGSALGALLMYAATGQDAASAATAWTYPFTTRGRMTGAFDPKNTWDYDNGHKGTDYHQADGRDATVRAIGVGRVVYTGGDIARTQLGNVVVIQHAEIWSLYAHLDPRQSNPFSVSRGDSVVNGTVLGLKGDTGYSKGAHLHLEVGHGSWGGESSRNYNVLFDSQTILDGAPTAPDIPTAVNDPSEDFPVNVQLVLYAPSNSLILIDHLNRTMRNLGNSPSDPVRDYFSKKPYTVAVDAGSSVPAGGVIWQSLVGVSASNPNGIYRYI